MTDYLAPFSSLINPLNGIFAGGSSEGTPRYLRDMPGYFADGSPNAADPLIYTTYSPAQDYGANGQMTFSTTVIEPGKIGAEYYMTKGHFHVPLDRAEVYYTLRGSGKLLLMSPDGKIDLQDMNPNTANFIPPSWAHRSINCGTEPFVFLSIYLTDGSVDYDSIARHGFASRLVDRDGQPTLIPNPSYNP